LNLASSELAMADRGKNSTASSELAVPELAVEITGFSGFFGGFIGVGWGFGAVFYKPVENLLIKCLT
jgi:uncharacterized membrane protein YfcA